VSATREKGGVRRGGYSFEGSEVLSQGLKNAEEGKGTLWGEI
jgi:hypothetical protein